MWYNIYYNRSVVMNNKDIIVYDGEAGKNKEEGCNEDFVDTEIVDDYDDVQIEEVEDDLDNGEQIEIPKDSYNEVNEERFIIKPDENKVNSKLIIVIIGIIVVSMLVFIVIYFSNLNIFKRYLENEKDYICLDTRCYQTDQNEDVEGIYSFIDEYNFEEHYFEALSAYHYKVYKTTTQIVTKYNWDTNDVVIEVYDDLYSYNDPMARYRLSSYDSFSCVYGFKCAVGEELYKFKELAISVKERSNELVDNAGVSYKGISK